MELFKELLDYGEYLNKNLFHQNLRVNLKEYGDVRGISTNHPDRLQQYHR